MSLQVKTVDFLFFKAAKLSSEEGYRDRVAVGHEKYNPEGYIKSRYVKIGMSAVLKALRAFFSCICGFRYVACSLSPVFVSVSTVV
jgi:hypothetical protein